MTVCVAAMYDGKSVLGASDRMLTAGDVQFEPQASKIRAVTTSIVVMLAGDSSMQEEILERVKDDSRRKVDAEPNKWLEVRDVAEFYRLRCNEARVKRSENAILAPLGLNTNTYITQQALMDSELVSKLATELINFRPPAVEAIIAGVDSLGPHIYVARGSTVSCQDGVGFAAVGAGLWHANSQLMFNGHTRFQPLPETLWVTYLAKRRAEVAPGVGTGTDMFFVPDVGAQDRIADHVLKELGKIYSSNQKKENALRKQTREKINDYVKKLTPPTTPVADQSTVPKDSGGNPSTDKEDGRDGPAEDGPHD